MINARPSRFGLIQLQRHVNVLVAIPGKHKHNRTILHRGFADEYSRSVVCFYDMGGIGGTAL